MSILFNQTHTHTHTHTHTYIYIKQMPDQSNLDIRKKFMTRNVNFMSSVHLSLILLSIWSLLKLFLKRLVFSSQKNISFDDDLTLKLVENNQKMWQNKFSYLLYHFCLSLYVMLWHHVERFNRTKIYNDSVTFNIGKFIAIYSFS